MKMMKTKLLYITLPFMMISMSSCLMKREHMYHFSKSDSLYFEVYDTLQSYVFKTNKGKDTLRFVEKNIVDKYN